MTRSMIAPQIRPSPPLRPSRPTSGTRSRLTLPPSFESNAGRTLSEPSIAIATTIIVATPNEANVVSPVMSMPAIARITVMPEMRTERPEVAAAASSAAAPGRLPVLAFTLQVEHRVVDADREPDQEHDCGGLRRHRQQLAGQRDQPEGGEYGGQGEEQRNACGHERSESDHEDDQRDRNREETGFLQVVRERRVNRLDRARVSEFPMKSCGWACCAFATRSSTGSIFSAALSASPRISNSTRTACPVPRDLARVGGVGERTF